MSRPGIIRVSFELSIRNEGGYFAYGRITLNNGPVLKNFSTTSETFVLCAADVPVPAGAYVEFWFWASVGDLSGGLGWRARNLKISYDPGSIIETQGV